MLTMRERWGSYRGRTLAYVGDAAPATSLAHARRCWGCTARRSPAGFELPARVVEDARAPREQPSAVFRDPKEAVARDACTTSGRRSARERSRRASGRSPITRSTSADGAALPAALFMHCLRRTAKKSHEVFESPASVVFKKAENRLHTEKLLLLMLPRSELRGETLAGPLRFDVPSALPILTRYSLIT